MTAVIPSRSIFGDRLLREPNVLEVFPTTHVSWWQGIRDGKYPAPIKLSPRVSVWRQSDIEALLLKLAEEAANTPQDVVQAEAEKVLAIAAKQEAKLAKQAAKQGGAA